MRIFCIRTYYGFVGKAVISFRHAEDASVDVKDCMIECLRCERYIGTVVSRCSRISFYHQHNTTTSISYTKHNHKSFHTNNQPTPPQPTTTHHQQPPQKCPPVNSSSPSTTSQAPTLPTLSSPSSPTTTRPEKAVAAPPSLLQVQLQLFPDPHPSMQQARTLEPLR